MRSRWRSWRRAPPSRSRCSPPRDPRRTASSSARARGDDRPGERRLPRLPPPGGTSRGPARPPRGPLLRAPGRGRVDDPEGRARAGGGPPRGGAARASRGDRLRGVRCADRPRLREAARREDRACVGLRRRPRGGRAATRERVRAGVAPPLGRAAAIPGDRPRRLLPPRARTREDPRGAAPLPHAPRGSAAGLSPAPRPSSSGVFFRHAVRKRDPVLRAELAGLPVGVAQEDQAALDRGGIARPPLLRQGRADAIDLREPLLELAPGPRARLLYLRTRPRS